MASVKWNGVEIAGSTLDQIFKVIAEEIAAEAQEFLSRSKLDEVEASDGRKFVLEVNINVTQLHS